MNARRRLSDRRKELEDEIPRLQASLDVLKIDRVSEAVVAADASDLASQWDACEPAAKRQFVEAITRKIVIGRDEVAIHLPYDRRHEQSTTSLTMALRMTPDGAQTLALKALGFVAGSDGALERLMELSGLDRDSLRARAGEPEVLTSLLDFLLMDEGLLVDFCHDESVDPKDVHMARHVLGGP